MCEHNGVDDSIVELLEDLLAKAKSGEIVAIAGVTATSEDGEFGEFYSDSALESCVKFVAYTRVLQMRFERQVEY